jgi:hypothetical protein
MPEQAEIIQELYNRMGSLPPEKQAIVGELARRFNIVAPSGVGDQMRQGAQAKALESMQADNPYNFQPEDKRGFFESAGDAILGTAKGLLHIPTAADTAPTPVAADMQDVPVQPVQQVGGQLASGNFAGAAGSIAGTGAALAAPIAVGAGIKAAPRLLRAAGNAAADRINLPRSGSPVQQAAADWAMAHGAPLDAASATGNPVIRGAQELAQGTIGAGAYVDQAIQNRNQWYAAKGRELAAELNPNDQTPETAGRAVYEQGVKTIREKHSAAGEEYSAFRDRAEDPANHREVVTGTKQETVQMQTGTRQEVVPGVAGPDGKPAVRDVPIFEKVTRDVPVKETVPFPVDLSEFKAALKPQLEEVQRLTRLGQSHYAPAQVALEDIINGPDIVPATVAEKNLGALKAVARSNTETGGVRNEAGQLAGEQVRRMQAEIDASVKQIGGVDALNELHQGRLERFGQAEAAALVDQFKAEPVKLFQQLTSKNDSAIDLLRKVQKLAPDQMGALGRAWLDGAMDKATDQGGLDHADANFKNWQDLGDNTKKILFKNPAMISDLDKFFQSMKDSAKKQNPSGTAQVRHIQAQAGGLASGITMAAVGHPLGLAVAGGYLIAGNALARLLYNPKFVRAAVKAMNTTARAPGAAAAAQAVVSAAGDAAVRTSAANAPEPIAQQAQSVPTSENGQTQPTATHQGNAVSEPIQAGGGAGSQAAGAATRSRATVVTVPGEQRGYKAEYKVKDLSEVRTSHSGLTFQANPQYEIKNDRNYSNAVNQGKVVNWSSRAEYDPSYHLTDNPDASNGPMVVDSAGNVLGGNGRGMIQQRVYSGNPKGAAAYKAMLRDKAAQFGLDPAEVDKHARPVLVREIADAELARPGEKQQAVTNFNKKPTAELTPAERAIADSRRVSASTLEDVSGRLDAEGEGATLAKVLASREGQGGVEVLNKLIADGVITPQERAALATRDKLTDAGKERISQLVLGRFFRDPGQLETIPASIRNKVEYIAAPLAQVDAKPEWSLTSHIQGALDILDEADKLHIKSVDDFIRQDGLFGGEKHSPQAVVLAKALHGMKPKALQTAVRQYSQDASYSAGGASMFGEAPTPASAFRDAFGEVPANNALSR